MLEHSAPVPTRVTFDPLTQDFAVAFDKPLRPDPALTTLTWTATSGIATFWQANTAAALHSRVSGSMVGGLFGPASGFLRYAPPPFDVVGRNGLPVAAFTLPWELP